MRNYQGYLVNANTYLELGQMATNRLFSENRPKGPVAADMALATLLLRVAELNMKMAEMTRVTP